MTAFATAREAPEQKADEAGAVRREFAPQPRIPSIDLMRGIVMVLMTLDHVRGELTWTARRLFAEASALPFDPTQLDASTPLFFWMRWITHFCAPAFIFLAGTGIFFWNRRHGTKRSLPAYLLTRGLLIALIGLWLDSRGLFTADGKVALAVLWAIGVSMMLLGILFRVAGSRPGPLLWMLALCIVLGHNALAGLPPAPEPWDALQRLALLKTRFTLPWGATVFGVYPFLPWFGVMLLGYLCSGPLFSRPAPERRLALLGAALIAAFILMRCGGWYGEPSVWRHWPLAWQTAADFFNLTKYPPSLQYLCMTLGPVLLGLALLGNANPKGGLLLTLGKTPLVYYVAHLVLINNAVKALAAGPESWRPFIFSVYGIAAGTCLVIALLYPCCRFWLRRRGGWPKNASGQRRAAPLQPPQGD